MSFGLWSAPRAATLPSLVLAAKLPASSAAALRALKRAIAERIALGGPPQSDELPSVWLLRVSERAFSEDLKVPAHQRGDVKELKKRHPILRRFFDDHRSEDRVLSGRPIDVLKSKKVFRIREEDERAAVWYDKEHGVVWLCRVLSISDFPDEPKLYERFARFEGDPNKNPPWPAVLFPEPAERLKAAAEQHLESIIVALSAACDEAFAHPQEWRTAHMRTPAGGDIEVGRAYVGREELEGGGELVTRFILVLSQFPEHLTRPADWQRRIVAGCFASDEEVGPGYELPRGTGALRDGEVPLMQRRLEE